jgi:hypothetical protein
MTPTILFSLTPLKLMNQVSSPGWLRDLKTMGNLNSRMFMEIYLHHSALTGGIKGDPKNTLVFVLPTICQTGS